MKKVLTLLNTLIVGLIATLWTGAGESSDPVLADAEMPTEITNNCLLTAAEATAVCDARMLSRRWVAKTSRGDLFIVTNEHCTGHECRAWLVEKSADHAAALLGFEPSFRLRGEKHGYPVIESYAELSAIESEYHRYEWNGASYAKAASRQVYNVDGRECGTGAECRDAAHEAITQQHVDRAVRIWENVHGVSWI